VNEIAQWLAIAFLGLLVLGLYVQLAQFLRDREPTLLNDISGPKVGKRVPGQLLIEAQRAGADIDRSETCFAFVTETCAGCRRLLANLSNADTRVRIQSDPDRTLVLVTLRPSAAFIEAIRQLELPVIADQGELWRSCNIQATPFVMTARRGAVRNKGVDHDVAKYFAQAA
jgi:hypothetical protein